MAELRNLIAKGWRVKKVRRRAGQRTIVCPVEGCDVELSIPSLMACGAAAEKIDGFDELALSVASRRYALGLSSDDVDYAAGLTQRHTQKIEDAGRKLAHGETFSRAATIALLLPMLEGDGLSDDESALLKNLLATAQKSFAQPRIPRVDTMMFVVQALGGVVKIEWGDPPAITRRLCGANR